jgi:hypothetical protein
MKKNTGRPPKFPSGERTTITMKIDADVKRKIITQAQAFDMTITEYVCMLVERDITS